MDPFKFLVTLPPTTLDRLYEDPWACQAVFQALPPLAQQFIMRLLTRETPVPQATLEQWMHVVPGDSDNDNDNQNVKDSGGASPTSPQSMRAAPKMPKAFQHALQTLVQSRLFLPAASSAYQVQPAFQRQLRLALTHHAGAPWQAQRVSAKSMPANLERDARGRWDAVLHYMVGSTAMRDPPKSVVDHLLRTKLMQRDPETHADFITDTGYEFMLKDIHVQLWIFLLEYIRTLRSLDQSGLRQEDILQFLFQLSFCEIGAAYAVADLSKTQQLLLNDFTEFGLLFRQHDWFYTPSLAVNLLFGGAQRTPHLMPARLAKNSLSTRLGSTDADAESNGPVDLQIIVETNFKIYAYTTSTLHVAMLSVFVDIVARLPNLAIGFLTRESLRSALLHGISAQQIYDFLMKHIHPNLLQNDPIIPENIADQIYLWERERQRVQFHDGWLFDGFNSKQEFEQLVAFAKENDVLTWSDPVHFKLSIAARGIDQVRHFIQHSG